MAICQLRFPVGATLIFLVSALPLSCQQAHVHLIPASTRSGTFDVREESAKVPMQLRELEVGIELPSHETVRWFVSMLYDPGTRLFWWHTDSVDFAAARRKTGLPATLPSNSVICFTKSRFILFWNGWASGGRILIRESTEHYSSLDEGQAYVLHVLEERRGDIEAGRFLFNYKEVVFPGLDGDFLYSRGDTAGPRMGPKLRDVTRVGNDWQIVEDGPNGGSAIIILNDTYQVVSVKVEPAK